MDRTLSITKRIIFTCGCLLTCASLLFGQLTAAQENERKRTIDMIEASENQRGRLPRLKRFYGKLTKEQEKRITPSIENVAKYRQFLDAPNTGIVKILPNPKCDLRIFDANDLKCAQALPIVGMGSSYSFSEKSHTKPSRVDISFTDNYLGLIVQMDDADLNSIGLDTQEIKLLNGFVPSKSFSENNKKRGLFSNGFRYKGRAYSSRALAGLGKTYALRSINYYRIRYFRWVDYFDDITLVLRIVEIDPDGALTLIWKELKKDSKVRLPKPFYEPPKQV
jgi:hypothetical protein